MKALTFKIDLLEPLLVSKIETGDPNSAVSYDYIPGSSLRGALIGRYAHQQGQETLDLEQDETAYQLFFSGAVRFLNAYIVDPQFQKRSLPTPLSLRIEKGKEDNKRAKGKEDNKRAVVYDFVFFEPSENTQYKSPTASFCQLKANEIVPISVERQVNIHIYRANPTHQTKHEDTIFRYDALAANQTFGGVIVADDIDDLTQIKGLLETSILHLGKSHHAGYGRVEIRNIELDTTWQEYTDQEDDMEQITVTCLSDLLIRDSETGQHVTDLRKLLPQATVSDNLKKRWFVKPYLVGGFNRKWGLPIPQTQAIQAGSVFVFDYDEALLEQLRSWTESGIGERIVDGFGRIAINWHTEPELTQNDDNNAPAPENVSLIHQTSIEMAERISERVLHAKLDSKLVETVNSQSFSTELITKHVTNAQLARVRQTIRQAIQENNPNLIVDYLGQLKRTARKQFEKAQVESKSLKEWLETLANQPDKVWDKFSFYEAGPNIGGQQAERHDDLAKEYALRLMDKLLHKASKPAKEKENE